jgi:ribonuclease T1
LIILILLLIVGYTARALGSKDSSHPPGSRPSQSQSLSSGARAGNVTSSGQDSAPLSSLPPEAAQTVRLIERGGPFPYSHDGVVYNNLERHLPIEPRGYYHEYTVRTPGSQDRGERRIITGLAGEVYYTADHYASFSAVNVGR